MSVRRTLSRARAARFRPDVEALEDRAVPALLTATDGPWTVEVRTAPTDNPESQGMSNWRVDPTPGHSGGELTLMDQEWFWYRIGDAGPERRISSLARARETASGKSIGLTYGGAFGDTLKADLDYTLNAGPGTLRSTITEQVTLTNVGNAAIDLHWFAYTALDPCGCGLGLSTTEVVAPGHIRQRSIWGDFTTVDVMVTGGPLPNHYQLAHYPTLRNILDDNSPTTLADSPSRIASYDATHAFEWDLHIQAGQSVQIVITKQVVGEVVMPTVQLPGGGFVFVDPHPPVIQLDNGWSYYDPPVSIGYDYTVNSGPNFANILLPVGFTDNHYTLHLDAAPATPGFQEGPAIPITGGVPYNLVAHGNAAGVSQFRIRGIEPEANVDPHDPVGFITGLQFISGGQVEFSQVPLTTPPEPVPQRAATPPVAPSGIDVTGRLLVVRTRGRKKAGRKVKHSVLFTVTNLGPAITGAVLLEVLGLKKGFRVAGGDGLVAPDGLPAEATITLVVQVRGRAPTLRPPNLVARFLVL